MNVETDAEAAQFPGKEYLNGIAVAVHGSLYSRYSSISDVMTEPDPGSINVSPKTGGKSYSEELGCSR